MSFGSFKNVTYKLFFTKDLASNNLQGLICHKTKPNPIYLIYVYKQDLASNNLQGLICHKTKPNPIYLIYMYKQDLASNNLQGLICHKTQPTNQTVVYQNFSPMILTYAHQKL